MTQNPVPVRAHAPSGAACRTSTGNTHSPRRHSAPATGFPAPNGGLTSPGSDCRLNGARPHHAGPAFTLIELLVVIAIISILCSLLLPALGRGKRSASVSAKRAGLCW